MGGTVDRLMMLWRDASCGDTVVVVVVRVVVVAGRGKECVTARTT